VRLLMTTPGVGPVVAPTYAAAIDDPGRFRYSAAVGAHFGLTPKIELDPENETGG
jgi:transposase